MDKLQKYWEGLGENDAYYAVSTFDKFRAEKLTDSHLDDFFKTGEDHIEKLWADIGKHFVDGFAPRRSLDFGCGVGRLVVPLSARSGAVVGADISRKMLEESGKNCQIRGLENTKFIHTNEIVSEKAGEFDFIHSFIVFQHIKPKDGEMLLEKMLGSLTEGGIGALHFSYLDDRPAFAKLRTVIYRDVPFANKIKDLVKGGKEPLIPIYVYDLNKIFAILQRNNCDKCLIRFTDHGMKGVFIIFQKKSDPRF